MAYIEGAFYLGRQWRGVFFWLCVRDIKNKHHWSHRLQYDQWLRFGLNPAMVIGKPPMRRRNIPSTGLLNMDQHGIKGGVEPKLYDEVEQFLVRFAGSVPSRKGEKLVQGLPCSIPLTFVLCIYEFARHKSPYLMSPQAGSARTNATFASSSIFALEPSFWISSSIGSPD